MKSVPYNNTEYSVNSIDTLIRQSSLDTLKFILIG